MKIRSIFFSLITGINLIYTSPVNAHNDGILNQIKEGNKHEIKFRIRTSTYPINYKDRKGVHSDVLYPVGFCVNLAKKLEEKLNEELNEENAQEITIDYQNHTYKEVDHPVRFQQIREKKYDIQCGADSIVDKDEIIFSKPFFTTGMNILIRIKDDNKIKSIDQLNEIKIGAINSTTTLDNLEDKYDISLNGIKQFSDRTKILDALAITKDIDAIASDDILVQGFKKEIVKTAKGNSDDYYFFIDTDKDEELLTNEDYGVVFHEDNYELRDYVNNLIDDLRNKYVEKLDEEGFKNLLSEEQLLIAERNGLTEERDSLIAERDGLTEERDSLIAERDGLTEERDSLIKENDNKLINLFISLILNLFLLLALIFFYKTNRKERLALLKYNKNEFDIEIFLYTLYTLSRFEQIKHIIIDNTSVLSSEEILFKIPLTIDIIDIKVKEFENKFNNTYEANKKKYESKLERKKQETHGFQNLQPIIEEAVKKLDKSERFSININLSIDNNKSSTKVNQQGKIGLGSMSGGEITGKVQATETNNEKNQ